MARWLRLQIEIGWGEVEGLEGEFELYVAVGDRASLMRRHNASTSKGFHKMIDERGFTRDRKSSLTLMQGRKLLVEGVYFLLGFLVQQPASTRTTNSVAYRGRCNDSITL